MNSQYSDNKPTLDDQISFVRNTRLTKKYSCLNGNLQSAHEEIQMLQAIEENLIAVRIWNTATNHVSKSEMVP